MVVGPGIERASLTVLSSGLWDPYPNQEGLGQRAQGSPDLASAFQRGGPAP